MSKYIPDEIYELMRANAPIVCVDILPVRKMSEVYEVGVIKRAIGSQTGKLTILGGIIRHSESIDEAIVRHLEHDLGVGNFKYLDGFSESQPLTVQQYFMTDSIESDVHGFDPTKHAIALTYFVEIDEAIIVPANEASEFVWVSEVILDKSIMGYNQHVVVNRALNRLNG